MKKATAKGRVNKSRGRKAEKSVNEDKKSRGSTRRKSVAKTRPKSNYAPRKESISKKKKTKSPLKDRKSWETKTQVKDKSALFSQIDMNESKEVEKSTPIFNKKTVKELSNSEATTSKQNNIYEFSDTNTQNINEAEQRLKFEEITSAQNCFDNSIDYLEDKFEVLSEDIIENAIYRQQYIDQDKAIGSEISLTITKSK